MPEETKKAYVSFDPGEVTGETGIPGVKLDFNYGARLLVPEGNWRVRFTDLDTSSILYEADASNALVTSTKKYYTRERKSIPVCYKSNAVYTEYVRLSCGKI